MNVIWAILRFAAVVAALLVPGLASAGQLAPRAETRVRAIDIAVETSLKATSLCAGETRSVEAEFAAEVASRCSILPRGGAGTDLPVLSAQPNNAVAHQSAQLLAQTRGDALVGVQQLSGVKGTLSIVGHGSPTSLGGMTSRQLAGGLQQAGFQGARLELVACQTGCSVYAQQVSNLLKVPVKAPLGNANVLSGVQGVPQVRIGGVLQPPGVGWQVFTPQGRLRAAVTNLFKR